MGVRVASFRQILELCVKLSHTFCDDIKLGTNDIELVEPMTNDVEPVEPITGDIELGTDDIEIETQAFDSQGALRHTADFVFDFPEHRFRQRLSLNWSRQSGSNR